jgi:hypothetical protein
MSCTGIQPNPDISGIGVRTAMYAQALLTLILPIVDSLDGHVSAGELASLHKLYLGILLPGCALVFCAIIQAKTYGLSVYHAIIVLNLSWINNTSALIFFQFALIAQIKLDEERGNRERVGAMLLLLYGPLASVVTPEKLRTKEGRDHEILEVAKGRATRMKMALRSGLKKGKEFEGSKEILEVVVQNLSALLAADDQELPDIVKTTNDQLQKSESLLRKSLGIPNTVKRNWEAMDKVKQIPGVRTVVDLLERDWIMAALASAHLTLFAAFGVWIWFTIHHFQGDCTKLTIFVPILVTSQPLRAASIVIYIICLLPIINIVILGSLEFGVIYGCQRLIPLIRTHIRNNESSASSFPESPKSTSLLASPGRTVLYQFVALTFLVQAYFIITTELTIHNNRHLLNEYSDSQESNWTFGQTLAIALIVIPLTQVGKEVWKDENKEVFKEMFKSLKELFKSLKKPFNCFR